MTASVQPALILIGLTGDDSNQAAQNIALAKTILPATAVVAYGIGNGLDAIRSCYTAGAGGYFSLASNEITECINTMMDGKTYFNSVMIDSFVFHLQARNRNFPGQRLTGRQRHIASLLAQGISPVQIAESTGVKAPSLAIAKGKIFKKLGVKTVRELQFSMNFYLYPG